MPYGTGRSLPVTAAITPGCASARDTSMPLMRAWACGERRIFANSMRGNTRSSAKTAMPVTFLRPSILRLRFPMTEKPAWGFAGASVFIAPPARP